MSGTNKKKTTTITDPEETASTLNTAPTPPGNSLMMDQLTAITNLITSNQHNMDEQMRRMQDQMEGMAERMQQLEMREVEEEEEEEGSERGAHGGRVRRSAPVVGATGGVAGEQNVNTSTTTDSGSGGTGRNDGTVVTNVGGGALIGGGGGIPAGGGAPAANMMLPRLVGGLRCMDVMREMEEHLVILAGGRDRRGAPILSFPQNPRRERAKPEDYKRLLDYLLVF